MQFALALEKLVSNRTFSLEALCLACDNLLHRRHLFRRRELVIWCLEIELVHYEYG